MALEESNKLVSVKQYTSEGENGTIFFVELAHQGLNDHKIFSSEDHPLVVRQVRDQLDAWEVQWLNPQEEQEAVEEVPLGQLNGSENYFVETDTQADIQKDAFTKVSKARIHRLNNILKGMLHQDYAIDWEAMKSFNTFTESPPNKPNEPLPTDYPIEPDFYDETYKPKLNIADRAIKPLKIKKKEQAYKKFQIAYKKWRKMCEVIERENKQRQKNYEADLKMWEKEMEEWKAREVAFVEKEHEENEQIDQLRKDYEAKDPASLLAYCNMVLDKISYPEGFPKDFLLDYSPYEQSLRLEHAMPTLEDVLMQHADENVEDSIKVQPVSLSDPQVAKLYDASLYSISLGILHALFQTDVADAIRIIEFNGWLASVDTTNNQEEKKCIFSLHTQKSAFNEMILTDNDPETTFELLGGVTHTQLNKLDEPVEMITEEPQYGWEVEKQQPIDNEKDKIPNIAAISNEAYERLIIEILEKEFSGHGEEINILQSDAEGEVHAIVIDPDPIRGGKIIIYAQQDRHKVELSVVKNLFDHVMQEGAIKGLLITPVEFTVEAYEFAKNKHLKLMNGYDLLSLLEKHGYVYRIDFYEKRGNYTQ